MKGIVQKYEILLFFVLTILIGWLPWVFDFGYIFIFAPSLAALIMAFLSGGWEKTKELFLRILRWRGHWRWWLLILFSPLILNFLAVGIHVLLGGTAPSFPLFRTNQQNILLVFLLFIFPLSSSALLEEFGFRGYALEELQQKYGPGLGTLILGLFFGAWLLPEFYNPDSFQYLMGGLAFYPFFILTELGWSFLMTWAYNSTNKSSLIAGYLFHAAFNTWAVLVLTNVDPINDTPPFAPFDFTLLVIAGLVVLAAGLAAFFLTDRKLGYQG